MPNAWTPEQILTFAPDASAAKAAREQSAARRWTVLGLSASDQVVWGLCQGSAAQPYQTQIDLSEPAFHCSCPSRKLPCKHSLGLFLLFSTQPDLFSAADLPAWVQEWLVIRRTRKPEPPPKPAAPAKRSERQFQRLRRVAAGVEELQRWLDDTVRQGFGASPVTEQAFWEAPARRMVDAQAPGLARRLRALATIPASGGGWQECLLAALGRLALLLEAYNRLDSLSAGLQADVRGLVGFTINQSELLKQRGVRGEWLVAAQRVDDDGSLAGGRGHTLYVQRTWLWERRSRRPALVLSFATAGQPLDASLVPGTVIDAELVFFPSAAPLRAVLKAKSSPPAPLTELPGHADLCALTETYARELACNPWLESWPAAVQAVTPLHAGGGWRLVDRPGNSLPLPAGYAQAWKLLALSCGAPIDCFGEWDGEVFLPLSCVTVDMAGISWHSLAGKGV